MDEAQSQHRPGFLTILGPAVAEFERLGRRRRVPAGEILFGFEDIENDLHGRGPRLSVDGRQLTDEGADADNGAVVLRSPVSQSDLASWTGLSREAVVKALRALRQLGWIDNQGRAFVIHDLNRVRDRATR